MSNPQTPASGKHGDEEPEITQEESVPSDGADAEGEEMMKQVSNPRLDETSKKPKP